MSKVVQWKRGNTSATTSYTGYEGEITVNTDTWNLHVHDGYTPGGWIIDSSNGGGEFGNLSAGNVAVTSAITTNTLVATGNVTADYFIGNGSLLTGISSYSDANVVAYSETGFAGNIIPSANVTYTLGNVTNQWASLYVSGNTIYLDNTPLSISGNMLSVNGTMIADHTYTDTTVNSAIATANADMKSYVDNEISAIGAHYSDANVVSLLSDFGSNAIVTTGNVTAGNFIGTFVGLSNVATSGSYNDLSDKPTIPSNLDDLSDVSVASANSGDMLKFISGVGWSPAPLAIVATTGSYNNLTDKPTLFSGSYNDLSNKPTIPSLGNYTITDNTIQTSSGVEGITLSIFGADQAVPDPAFIMRSWLFANTGTFTSPSSITVTSGNLNATGAVLTGNLTSGNLNTGTGYVNNVVTPQITAATILNVNSGDDITISTPTNLQLNATSGAVYVTTPVVSVTGNVTAGNILTDNYFYANGDPFVSGSGSNYTDANVVSLLSDFGSNNITTTGNITATVDGYAIGYKIIPQVPLTSNVTATLDDSGKHFYSYTAGDLSILLPTYANVAFPTGTAFTIVVQAAGNVHVNADSGVTLYMAGNSTPGNRVVGAYGMATLLQVDADTWFINGTGVS